MSHYTPASGADPGDDRRPPSWDGSGGILEKDAYLRWAEAFLLGLSDKDKHGGVIRLWRSLRDTAKDRMADLDFALLTTARQSTVAGKQVNEPHPGFSHLKEELEKAFPEGQLRQLPRLY